MIRLPPEGTTGTFANGINDAGQIVGGYIIFGPDPSHGFLHSHDTYATLDDPSAGSDGTEAYGINNSGQIVGVYFDGSGKAHGFLDVNGSYSTLDDPSAGPDGTYAFGINSSGQIVGVYFDGSGKEHGFLYSGGNYTTVDDPLGVNGTALRGINDTGRVVGDYTDSNFNLHGFVATPISAQLIQSDYLAITCTTLAPDQATTVANAIIAGTQTETQYVNGLLSQVADTTFPAVAIEGSMYGAVGSSAEITKLVTDFLPGQITYATQLGLDLTVFARQSLGLVFAFGNETGATTFATNFGPSNPSMPDSAAGDAAFAAAACSAILGSQSTQGEVSFVTSHIRIG